MLMYFTKKKHSDDYMVVLLDRGAGEMPSFSLLLYSFRRPKNLLLMLPVTFPFLCGEKGRHGKLASISLLGLTKALDLSDLALT